MLIFIYSFSLWLVSDIDLFITKLCVEVKFGVTALILAKAPAVIPTIALYCQCKCHYTENDK